MPWSFKGHRSNFQKTHLRSALEWPWIEMREALDGSVRWLYVFNFVFEWRE